MLCKQTLVDPYTSISCNFFCHYTHKQLFLRGAQSGLKGIIDRCELFRIVSDQYADARLVMADRYDLGCEDCSSSRLQLKALTFKNWTLQVQAID